MRCGMTWASLAFLLAAAPASARPPGLVDDRPVPADAAKLGTRGGRKIEPVDPPRPPPALPEVRPGGTWLRPDGDRAGFQLGYEQLGERYYALIWPLLDVTSDGLALSLGPPLRVTLFDPAQGVGVLGVRDSDWNQLADLQRFVNQLRWRTGDLTLRVTRFERTTLGEGALVRDHEPNSFVGTARLSTLASVAGELAEAQAYLDDLAALHVVGLRGALHPFGGGSSLARTLTLALTGAADVAGPRALATFETGVPRTREDDTFVIDREEAITGGGVTLSATVLDTGRTALTPFLDHTCIGGLGCGQTVGATLRLGERAHVDLRLEVRRFDDGYLPAYFDSTYEMSRLQLRGSGLGFRSPPKYAALGSGSGGGHVGYLAGVTWVVPGLVAARLAVENSDAPASMGFLLHAEVPVWRPVQAVATLERRNLSGGPLVAIGGDDTTAYFGARVRVSGDVHAQLAWFRRFALDRALGLVQTETGGSTSVELTWGL